MTRASTPFGPVSLVLLAAACLAIAPVAAAPVADAVTAGAVGPDGATDLTFQDDGANQSGDSANASNATEPAELRPIDPATAAGTATGPTSFDGEGPTVTEPVPLEDGLLVVTYAHEGESNVQVTLWDESADEPAAFLVNRIGAVEGATAAPVTAGNYSLDVTADGAWNVTLVQPNSTALAMGDDAADGNATGTNESTGNASDAAGNASDAGGEGTSENGSAAPANDTAASPTNVTGAPAIASGEGPAVVGPVAFEESVTVTANHSGESNFQVTIWSESATSALDGTYVFNEIGQVEAAETRVAHEGPSWVVVNADGEWDLAFD